MKGLLKYLAPFAPDPSGVVSVLYGLGGLLVVCDAGGCTGNICGFDEPRWSMETSGPSSAIFSAGLRDMDAILGRDEALIDKLADAAAHVEARFIALIGTPVPAVIATDFDALRTWAEERTGLPTLVFPCTGTRLYDAGEREAYRELFRAFAEKENIEPTPGTLGVIGCTPLDISRTETGPALDRYARQQGFSEVYAYGMGAGLDELRRAGSVEKNLVVAPAGIAAAEYLRETFGTPYEIAYPFFDETFDDLSQQERILIVHQQVAAHEIRRILRGQCAGEEVGSTEPADGSRTGIFRGSRADIVCGTWFSQISELTEPGDVVFDGEDSFAAYVADGGFDVVIGDPRFRRVLRGFTGEYIDCPHFAVSGILEGNYK